MLLPAPFRPMIPTTFPRLISKETSRRAQKLVLPSLLGEFGLRKGEVTAVVIASRIVL